MTKPHMLIIGRKKIRVASLEAASQEYCAYKKIKDATTRLSSTPTGTIVDIDGNVIGRVSYNGRVWSPEPWTPDASPIYDNRI